MNCFELLRIEQTKDKKIIKKAYAKQLKTIDMENNVEGYQALRQALKEALTYGEIEEEPIEKIEHISSEVFEELTISDFKAVDFNFIEPIRVWINELENFLELETYFVDVKGWESLLVFFSDCSLDDYISSQKIMKDFLLARYHVLSFSVKERILRNSGLNDEKKWLNPYEYFIYNEEIIIDNKLDFNCYIHIDKTKRYSYFESRYFLFDHFYKKNFSVNQLLVEDSPVIFLEESSYQDDDVKYLLACRLLLKDKKELNNHYPTINNYFITMKSNKYAEDIKLITKYLEKIKNPSSIVIRRNDLVKLEYTPSIVTKKMISDLFPTTSSKGSASKKTFNQIIKENKYIVIGLLLILAFLFLGILDSKNSNKNIDIEQQNVIKSKLVTPRYAELIYESLLEDSHNEELSMTKKGRVQFLELKNKEKDLWQEVSTYNFDGETISEKHNLSSLDVGYFKVFIDIPENENLQIEALFNSSKELDSINIVKDQKTSEIGSLDAIELFLYDVENSINQEDYIVLVHSNGKEYLDKDLQRYLVFELSGKEFEKLKKFNYSNSTIQLLDDTIETTVFLTNDSGEIMIVILDKENKIKYTSKDNE